MGDWTAQVCTAANTKKGIWMMNSDGKNSIIGNYDNNFKNYYDIKLVTNLLLIIISATEVETLLDIT